MKIKIIKFQKTREAITQFITTCASLKIDVYVTWSEEDLFADILYAAVAVPETSLAEFENKYAKNIVHL